MTSPRFVLVAAVLTLFAANLSASNLWLHMRVEKDDDPQRVTINLPFSAVERASALFPPLGRKESRIEVAGTVLNFEDMQKIVRTLETADGAFVKLDRGHGTVLFIRRGNEIRVGLEADHRNGEPGLIRMPMNVARALVSGSNSFNLAAAIGQLSGKGGEIVLVDSHDARVRIWVDGVYPKRRNVSRAQWGEE